MTTLEKQFQHHDANPNYFGAETLEWDQYHQFRPSYPKELFEIIFNYHNRNGNEWSLAADFGSGPGTIVPNLLERFQTVHGSDLNERQIKLGKSALQEKFGEDRVSMHVGAAGNCDWIKDGSADIFTSAEAVQWFDSNLWVEEASKKLKPGGTLAFWYYSPNCTIISHPEAAFYCNKLFSILFESVWSSEGFPRGPVEAHALKLKNIAIASTKFQKEVRQFWQLPENVAGVNGLGENPPSSFSLVKDCPERIAKDAKVIDQECKDANSCFLQRSSWTSKELLHYIESLGMPMDVLYKHKEYDSTMDSLHQIVGGEQGTFTVGWWLSLVMATRA